LNLLIDNKIDSVVLSKKSNIICKYTSFVAIESKESPIECNMISRKIPLIISKDCYRKEDYCDNVGALNYN